VGGTRIDFRISETKKVGGRRNLAPKGWLKAYNGRNHLSIAVGFLPSTVGRHRKTIFFRVEGGKQGVRRFLIASQLT
jgi:hypothetical protein